MKATRMLRSAAGLATLASLAVACSDEAGAPATPEVTGGASSTGGLAGAATGGASATGGGGTGGTSATLQPATPTVDGTVYSFAVGTVSFSVDAGVGARITSLATGGLELLSGPTVNASNYGSTFWTSPQSAWGWPPPPAVDSLPYDAAIEGASIVMTGSVDPALGVSVSKIFSADVGTGWITIAYTVANAGAAAVSHAPWEITRVPLGGLAFFPLGSGGILASSTLLVSTIGAEVWFDSATQAVADKKVFADGDGGWSAHAANGFLFLKKFTDLPAGAAATGEAEIEIYSGAGYVELEVQGAPVPLQPGESFTWTTRWKVVPIPADVPAVAGSAELVAFAAAVASG